MSFRAIASIGAIFLGLAVTAALAQQFAQPASTACSAINRGTVNCPTYIAPATTVVPRTAMDGSLTVPGQTSTTLFNGALPPNGFMIQMQSEISCYINDNGPAAAGAGFFVGFANVFVTPQGYRPIGAVSIWCSASAYVAARGW
jgi:hypothetical protein